MRTLRNAPGGDPRNYLTSRLLKVQYSGLVTPYESYNGERDRGQGTVTLCASNWFTVADRVHAEPLVTITVETYFLLLIFNTNYCYVISFLDLSICYDTRQYPDTYYLTVIDVRIS